MLKLAFIGDLTIDVYPKLKKNRLGGASLISAMWAKKLGAKATILAAVGNDEAGKSYQEFFKNNNLSQTSLKIFTPRSPAERDEGEPTSQIEIFLDKKGERTFGEWQPGVYAKYHLDKKDFDFLKTQDAVVMPVYYKTRHLLKEIVNFQFSIFNQIPNTNNQLQMTNVQRPLLVLDFDDLSQFGKQTAIIEKHLSLIDIVKLGLDMDKDKGLINKIEKLASSKLSLRGRVNQGDRTRQSVFLITLGSFGSLVFSGGKTYRQKALLPPGGKIIATTGAGDAFLAGFLVDFLKSPTFQTIPTSLIIGSQVAAKAILWLEPY